MDSTRGQRRAARAANPSVFPAAARSTRGTSLLKRKPEAQTAGLCPGSQSPVAKEDNNTGPGAVKRGRGRPSKRLKQSGTAASPDDCPAPCLPQHVPAQLQHHQPASMYASTADAACPSQSSLPHHSPPSASVQQVTSLHLQEGPGDEADQDEELVLMTRAAVKRAATAPCFSAADADHVALVMAALGGDAAADISEAAAPGRQVSEQTEDVRSAPHGRQQQFQQLHSLLRNSCTEGVGASVYISGLPGTGKSHTVRAVLSALASKQLPTIPTPVFVSCFGLKDPGDIYKVLLTGCAGQLGVELEGMALGSLRPEEAHQQLLKLLQRAGSSGRGGPQAGKARKGAAKGGNGRMLVLVLDELDRMLGARSGLEDLVKLFMLPHAQGVRCCVVGLANSIDITERCLPELKLRGCAPTFMPFGAYLRPQLLAILGAKLAVLPWAVYEPSALELAARKVSATSGDTRKALQACRVALRALHQEQLASADPPPEARLGARECAPRHLISPSRVSASTGALCARLSSPTGIHPLSPTCVSTSTGALSDHLGSPTGINPLSPTRRVPCLWSVASPAHSPRRILLPAALLTSAVSPSSIPGQGPAITGCTLRLPAQADVHGSQPLRAAAPGVGLPSALAARPVPDLGLAPRVLVGVRHMHAALARILKQSGGANSVVHTVRTLPQQQQVHLLAVAAAVAGAATSAAEEARAEAAAAEHGMSRSAYAARWYFGPASNQKQKTKLANPFASALGLRTAEGTSPHPVAVATPHNPKVKVRDPLAPSAAQLTPGCAANPVVSGQQQGTPSGVGGVRTPTSVRPRAVAGALAGDAARAVPLGVAYDQYRCLCGTLFQQPGSEQEFLSVMQLLSHLGLVTVSMGVGASGSRSMGRGLTATNAQLVLRAGVRDIQTALRDNALFRRALSALPAE